MVSYIYKYKLDNGYHGFDSFWERLKPSLRRIRVKSTNKRERYAKKYIEIWASLYYKHGWNTSTKTMGEFFEDIYRADLTPERRHAILYEKYLYLKKRDNKNKREVMS